MYADLPEQIKQVVREYLLADDFRTAKQIHDDWMESRQSANEQYMQTCYSVAESY